MIALAIGPWLLAALVLATARIPAWAALGLGIWLLAAIAVEVRTWWHQPVRAVWRPRKGWSLEWPCGLRRPASLRDSSRVFPGWLALEWTGEHGRRTRLLLLPGRNNATSLRRLRVLLRHGRADG
jgi:hypothetical protein